MFFFGIETWWIDLDSNTIIESGLVVVLLIGGWMLGCLLACLLACFVLVFCFLAEKFLGVFSQLLARVSDPFLKQRRSFTMSVSLLIAKWKRMCRRTIGLVEPFDSKWRPSERASALFS